MPWFMDRADAGRRLARAVAPWQARAPIVVGIARGGVPVAIEVARRLRAPLDVVDVERFGAPGRPFTTVGAVAERGARVLDAVRLAGLGLTPDDVAPLMDIAGERTAGRREMWIAETGGHTWWGRTVILVDDGATTGSTAHAAILTLRAAGARHVVLAVPAASTHALRRLEPLVDGIVCPHREAPYPDAYERLERIDDAHALALLHAGYTPARPVVRRGVPVTAGTWRTTADLLLPPDATGLVIMATTGRSRRGGTGTDYLTRALYRGGLATLVFDALPETDGTDWQVLSDVRLLSRRFAAAGAWAWRRPELTGLPVGYLGTGSTSGPALAAAAGGDSGVIAVAAIGGRPDLAGPHLLRLMAPALLVTSADSSSGMHSCAHARDAMLCDSRTRAVPGTVWPLVASRTRERVGEIVRDWFRERLAEATLLPRLASSG